MSRQPKKRNNEAVDCGKIYNALKKLEPCFSQDHDLMSECSEFLIKEVKLNPAPVAANVCNWITLHTKLFITVSDGRNLLRYVSLQLNKEPSLKHCALLPPAKLDYEKWFITLKGLSKGRPVDRALQRGGSEVQIYSVEENKLKKKNKIASENNASAATSARLRGSEDPTLQMFPSVATPQSTANISSSQALVPTKFKENSNSMSYKRYGSHYESGQKPMSVTEMVALARRKQHYDRLRRLHEEEVLKTRSGIDYGVSSRKVRLENPELKRSVFNDNVDSELFGVSKSNNTMINQFGIYSDVSTKMSKAKPRFVQESTDVKGEVYRILGVTADTTVQPRKY